MPTVDKKKFPYTKKGKKAAKTYMEKKHRKMMPTSDGYMKA